MYIFGLIQFTPLSATWLKSGCGHNKLFFFLLSVWFLLLFWIRHVPRPKFFCALGQTSWHSADTSWKSFTPQWLQATWPLRQQVSTPWDPPPQPCITFRMRVRCWFVSSKHLTFDSCYIFPQNITPTVQFQQRSWFSANFKVVSFMVAVLDDFNWRQLFWWGEMHLTLISSKYCIHHRLPAFRSKMPLWKLIRYLCNAMQSTLIDFTNM